MATEIIWDDPEGCYRLPARLDQGVRCGNHPSAPAGGVRHNSTEAVRECYRVTREWEEESRAEIWAEGGYVRMMENWGAEQAAADDAIARSLGIPV